MEETLDALIRAAKAKLGSPFLTTAQAGHYLGLSPRTLERLRRRRRGPKWRRHGGYVHYHIDDLDAWNDEGRPPNGDGHD